MYVWPEHKRKALWLLGGLAIGLALLGCSGWAILLAVAWLLLACA